MPRAQPKRRRVVRHFNIHDRLDPVHHAALEALVRGRDRNMKAVVEWLAALGCRVPLGTVCRYRDHVLEEDDRRAALDAAAFREAQTAVIYARVVARGEAPDLTTPAATLCRLLATLSITLLRHEPDLTPFKLRRYVAALDELVRVSYARRAPESCDVPESLN